MGLLLSFLVALGYLALRALATRHLFSLAWLRYEVARDAMAYAYVAISTMTITVALGWWLGRRQDRLEIDSNTDPLTGLANRRCLEERFSQELRRATRYATPLGLLLIDLDRLKEINDLRGHGAGDAALQSLAESLIQHCRSSDLAARWGGDEFVVLAPNTSALEALAMAQRIRTTLRERAGAGKMPSPVSISIGIADLDRSMGRTLEAVHAAADRALYLAKQAGRDRAVVAPLVHQEIPDLAGLPAPGVRTGPVAPLAERSHPGI